MSATVVKRPLRSVVYYDKRNSKNIGKTMWYWDFDKHDAQIIEHFDKLSEKKGVDKVHIGIHMHHSTEVFKSGMIRMDILEYEMHEDVEQAIINPAEIKTYYTNAKRNAELLDTRLRGRRSEYHKKLVQGAKS